MITKENDPRNHMVLRDLRNTISDLIWDIDTKSEEAFEVWEKAMGLLSTIERALGYKVVIWRNRDGSELVRFRGDAQGVEAFMKSMREMAPEIVDRYEIRDV